MDHVTRLLEGLATDLDPTGLSLQVGVYDLAHRRWIAGSEPEPLPDFGDSGYVLVLPGRQHLLPETPDGSPSLLGIADDVREWAMDELGHGWPELYDGAGVFLALLEPRCEFDRLMWTAGERHIAIGELSSASVAVPPRWDGT